MSQETLRLSWPLVSVFVIFLLDQVFCDHHLLLDLGSSRRRTRFLELQGRFQVDLFGWGFRGQLWRHASLTDQQEIDKSSSIGTLILALRR